MSYDRDARMGGAIGAIVFAVRHGWDVIGCARDSFPVK